MNGIKSLPQSFVDMRDRKMTDKMSGAENAGLEIQSNPSKVLTGPN
jgi:hypothetical protein